MGPRLSAGDIHDPLIGDFTKEDDRKLIPDLVRYIAARYREYGLSGSTMWAATLNMKELLEWLIMAGTPGVQVTFDIDATPLD